MIKIISLMIALIMISSTQNVNAQGRFLLQEKQGVSLSYNIDFYNSCESFMIKGRKNQIFKVTAYLSNKSGKQIKMEDSYISHEVKGSFVGEENDRSCMDLNGMQQDKANFSPSGTWWDRDAGYRIFESNTTLTQVYYFVVPANKKPWDPTWYMGAFKFLEEKQQSQWSNWIGGDCFKKISYRYMGKELVNLNYQYHYYFQAKNDYAETVYFIMSLKDADGKERFGTRYTIRPGQTIEFVEKMDKNYIRSFAVEKVCFKIDNGNYVACDDERKNIPVSSTGNKTPSSAINRAEIERDAKKAIDIFCRYWELDGRSFDLRMKGKTDEKLDKELEALEKELEEINIQMFKKYDENKNKAAYDLYNKFWGEGYDKCPYKQSG